MRILPTPVSDCARGRSRVCASTRARAQSNLKRGPKKTIKNIKKKQSNRCRSSESSTRASALPLSYQARLSSPDLDNILGFETKQGCKAWGCESHGLFQADKMLPDKDTAMMSPEVALLEIRPSRMDQCSEMLHIYMMHIIFSPHNCYALWTWCYCHIVWTGAGAL